MLSARNLLRDNCTSVAASFWGVGLGNLAIG